MSNLYESNAAIEVLMQVWDMSEDNALYALDFAEDSGEFTMGRLSVVCQARGVFLIERR